MREEFLRDLRDSLYVHRPLPLHRERELEARFPAKKVLASRPVAAKPEAAGTATLRQQDGDLAIHAPLRGDRWPEGAPADGDYCNFGTARLVFRLEREDWRDYNRLRFRVKPRILGARILHLNVSVRNRGKRLYPTHTSGRALQCSTWKTVPGTNASGNLRPCPGTLSAS